MSGTKSASEKKEVELTREAKEAVRSYMLSLIALPAIFLTVISAAGGFFLNKVAFQDGYNEAYKTAISDVVTAAKDVGIAKSNANDALKSMNDAIKEGLAKLAVSLQDAAKASEDSKLTSQRASSLINSDINGLATTLAKTEVFQRAADNVLIPGFAALSRDVADNSLRLKMLSEFKDRLAFKAGPIREGNVVGAPSAGITQPDAVPSLQGTPQARYVPSRCPENTYAVGIKWWGLGGNSDGAGLLAAMQILCSEPVLKSP